VAAVDGTVRWKRLALGPGEEAGATAPGRGGAGYELADLTEVAA
jgi:hypothetical protein